MSLIVAVGVGGVIGALFRYFLSSFFFVLWGNVIAFPIETLIINLIGAFILGWFTILGSTIPIPKVLKVGFSTGLIGSFTTFSTLAVEVVQLFTNHQLIAALIYIFLSINGGLLMVWLGTFLAELSLKGK